MQGRASLLISCQATHLYDAGLLLLEGKQPPGDFYSFLSKLRSIDSGRAFSSKWPMPQQP